MILRTALLLSAVLLPDAALAAPRECAQSPGKMIEVCVAVDAGRATYEVTRAGKPVLAPSALGLTYARYRLYTQASA